VHAKKDPAFRNSKLPRKYRLRNQLFSSVPSAVRTYGELFPNGVIIDLVEEAGREPLGLAVFDGKHVTIAREVEFEGRLFRPATLSRSIRRIVRFPGKSVDFESTTKLFAATHQLFISNGFPAEAALSVTYFIFAAYFAEVLPVAPCLLITGPRLEATYLLELLACVVRHPLPISEFTRRALCSLPMQLKPTLLINTEQIRSASLELLRVSNRHNAFFPLKGNLVDLFCAKVVYCGDIVDSEILGESALQICLPPCRERLPIFDKKYSDEVAREFQAKFFAYRCRHILDVRDSQFDLPEFTSGTRILARLLGAPIVDAPALRAGLIRLLQEHEEKRQALRWTDLRCVVIEALLHHCHKEPGARMHVGEITETATRILKGRGDETEREPREIGPILKSFGLHKKRDRDGFAILLDPTVCRHVHQLAYGYDVSAMRKDERGHCTYCNSMLRRPSEFKKEETQK
jgi:hypothetical protein